MRIGKLDRRISIEYRNDHVDSFGQSLPVWSTLLANVPAAYEPDRGREFFVAQAMSVDNPALFRVRYRADLSEQMRVLFEGKVWDVVSALEGRGRHRETLLYCSTGLIEG